jgi:DNA-binding transcriptional LysR family regulator
MLNLNQLQHFRFVAETGNFAAAARKAHITQPALSNSIRILEERMEVQLFDRSERPIRLTPAGHNILSRIDLLLNVARDVEKQVGYLAQGLAGELKVGMTSVSSASFGGVILGKWLSKNAKMKVDVSVADTLALMEGLRAEKLDLIIGDSRDLPKDLSEFDLVPITSEEGRAYCRTGHPVLDVPKPTFRDLLPYRFAGSHFPKELLEHLAKLHQLESHTQIDLAIESDNISLMRDATMNSDLILLTTRGCVRNALNANLLVELPVDLQTSGDWYAVTLKNAVLHPAIPSLRKEIFEASAET